MSDFREVKNTLTIILWLLSFGLITAFCGVCGWMIWEGLLFLAPLFWADAPIVLKVMCLFWVIAGMYLAWKMKPWESNVEQKDATK